MSKTLQNVSCGAVTGLLIISVIIGAIGIALIETLIGLIPGLVLLLVSGIFFIIGIISLITFLVKNRGKVGSFGQRLKDTFYNNLSWWCLICILVSICIIIGEIVVTAKYFGYQPANPVPSNDAVTQPATQN